MGAMRSWSISVGRVFGIDLRIHLSFFILPLFIWWTDYAASHTANHPVNTSRDMALVGIIFACVIVHELGHAVVATREGIPAKSIILLPIGGVTMLDDSRPLMEAASAGGWKRDVRIAVAGPLVNIVLAIVSGGILLAVIPDIQLFQWPFMQSSHLARSIVWANLYLAGFNLLPAYPMDGGRALRALFARRMDPVSATRRAVSIGHGFAWGMILLGIIVNFWWLSLVGAFLFFAAQLEERSVVFQSVLETVHMDDIMLTDFATLSPADTLEDALEKAVHSLQDDFPVVRGTDMVGVVSRHNILDALRAEGNGYVQSVMNRMFEVANPRESLASAYRKLSARNLSIIPVVEDQRLVGIVTLQNLMHSMALLAESRKLRREALNS
jgi:Zn-dependent protease/CBS domain-containing protein